ncbi:hypothetical protein [Virgisporangium aurantiacum]|uniref:Uncharacterized protein n=1 Tax=Virgisporangium aurantiacum TaxID=175570 RepID=A0A8J3YZS8_9ACTN|nr:hypothetical protein [Virgisporangium aurantiacum]GIJ52725.1 hypothetical protein Vau01_002410 [Virgisporangium aurantiacum]
MQPHQYPAPGYPPDASWPDEYAPVPSQPAPDGPLPSPVPVAFGATAAGVAALALLVLGVMSLVVFRAGPADRNDGDVIVTVLIVWASLVAALLLAYSIGLIVAGRDAGRSGIVWIGVAALPWTILIPAGIVEIASHWEEYLSDGFITVASVVSYACGGLAAFGLLTAMIVLGIPPGRRWLAARVLARTGALWPPAPLVAARKRFTFSAFLGMGGCAAQLILTLLVTEDGNGRSTFLAVSAVILVLLVAVPQLLGVWGGRLAFAGRRGGAHLARAAGVFLIYGVQPFVLIGVLNGLAGVFDTDAILPDAAGGPLAAVVTAAIMLGIVQYVAGLAALADPRSELYLRSGGRRPG